MSNLILHFGPSSLSNFASKFCLAHVLLTTMMLYPFVCQYLNRYILPFLVGFLSIFFRTVLDWTCSSWSQTCSVGSEVLSHVYQVVFFFLVIVASTKAKQLSEAAARFKKAFEVLLHNGGDTKIGAVTGETKKKAE